MKFQLSSDVKDKKKGYYKNITDKNTRENVDPLATRQRIWPHDTGHKKE